MKLMSIACACMFLVAGAYGDSSIPLTSDHWLSFLGSRPKVEEYMSNHIMSFSIQLDKTNGMISTHEYPYSRSQGSLRDQIAQKLALQMASSLTSADAGQQITPWIGMRYPMKRSNGSFTAVGRICSKPPFLVQTNGLGQIIVPTNDVVAWPLNQFVIVTNAPKGILQVEYLWKYPNGNIFLREVAPSGIGGYPFEDGVLDLSVTLTDKELLLLYGITGQLILHYSGWTETFDVIASSQTDSTFIHLRMSRFGNMPLVYITGWPGKEVALESSSNLSAAGWQYRGSEILDVNGQGVKVFTPPPTREFFVRGRTTATAQ